MKKSVKMQNNIFKCIRQLLNIDILQQRPRKNPPNERKEENPGKVCISCRLLLALSIYSVLVSVGLQIILGMGGGRERGGDRLASALMFSPPSCGKLPLWEIPHMSITSRRVIWFNYRTCSSGALNQSGMGAR